MSDIIPDTGFGVMVDELKKRGVAWPVGGFSPGRYNVVCRSCARRFDGDKRSYQCLPCAITKAIWSTEDIKTARMDGERTGYRQAIADLTEVGRLKYPQERVIVQTENQAKEA